jgi:hypothetical protein
VGGLAWLGTCGQHWTSNGNIHVLFAGARVMGVLMVIAARGGGGYVCHFPPSPSSDRLSLARNACKKLLGWTFNVTHAGERVMGVSMVIAA